MNCNNPKQVIRIESDPVSINYKYYDETKLLSHQVDVCSYEYELTTLKDRYNFMPAERIPCLGDTYIKDPFDNNSYIHVTEFQDFILRSKQNCISKIASLLGASKYRFEIEVQKAERREWDINANGGYKVVDCGLNIKNKRSEELKQAYSIENSYEKTGDFSIKNYEEAIKYAQQFNLYSDLDVRALLEQRHPDSFNKLKCREVKFSMSKEINSGLDIAFTLNATPAFKLDVAFKNATEYKESLVGKLRIEF